MWFNVLYEYFLNNKFVYFLKLFFVEIRHHFESLNLFNWIFFSKNLSFKADKEENE